MNLDDIELPSNRKFGLLFAIIFTLAGIYFYVNEIVAAFYVCAVAAVGLLVAVALKPAILLPANKIWMRFGLLLSMIVGPIVLGVLFFGIFTPIAMIMRLFKRDELNLSFSTKRTHWQKRSQPMISKDSFKMQF